MNYTHIKPTKYAGILFRSRLEARWAVLFDALGIAWEYEPETFRWQPWGPDHGATLEYTPDFRLPRLSFPRDARLGEYRENASWSTYVEVKPTAQALNDIQKKICMGVEYEGPLAGGFIAVGPIPQLSDMYNMPAHVGASWARGVQWCAIGFKGGDHVIAGRGPSTQGESGIPDEMLDMFERPRHWHGFGSRTIADAYNAARNERFNLHPVR